MPFHFCQDELFAILAAIPVISAVVLWIRAKLAKRRAKDIEITGIPASFIWDYFKDGRQK